MNCQLADIDCHWLSLAVIGCHWLSLAVIVSCSSSIDKVSNSRMVVLLPVRLHEEGMRLFFDGTLPNGSVVHSMARHVAQNPVTGITGCGDLSVYYSFDTSILHLRSGISSGCRHCSSENAPPLFCRLIRRPGPSFLSFWTPERCVCSSGPSVPDYTRPVFPPLFRGAHQSRFW